MSRDSDGKTRKPRAVEDIARGADRGLGSLLAHARHLEAIDRTLESCLDPRHAPHVRVANVRDGKLILATPVAPIAARLRMEERTLLDALQRAHPGEFQCLEVVITPDLPGRER